MKKTLFFALIFSIFTLISGFSKSGKPIYLWKNTQQLKNEKSVMYYHKAENAEENAPCIIICPGGSYHHLGLYNEGYKTAQWFSKKGVHAFTLRYRTNEASYNHPAMLQDIQKAIQIIRENAQHFGINENKIGLIGFSAGGHLVTMAGAFFESHDELKKIGIEHEVSLKPNFIIPVYPVVSMQDEIAHKWSRKSLLGKNPTQEQKDEFSMEKQIFSGMPPVYVIACKDDNVVDYRNSVELVKSLQKNNVPHKFSLYDWGKHGFGMLENRFMKTFHYNDEIFTWLLSIDFGQNPKGSI